MNKKSTKVTSSNTEEKKVSATKSDLAKTRAVKEPAKESMKASAAESASRTNSNTAVATKETVNRVIQSVTEIEESQKAPQKTAALPAEYVANSAYILWENEGRPHGQDKAYWFRAEEELRKALFVGRKSSQTFS